jgi:flagellar basal-body rod modification protein FlgD
MSTIPAASSVSSLFGAGSTSTAGASATAGSAADMQNRFLSLLVAQMQNQDPLNPLDNAQVTSQMAQLSTVQGINNMSTSLQALATSMGANQMSQSANLIGHNVMVPGNTISPSQPQNVVGVQLVSSADTVSVSINDASGNAVRTMNLGSLPMGVNTVAWNGMTDSGTAAPAGNYTFSVNATQGGQAVSSTALDLDVVNSVSQNSQGVQLNLASNTSVGYSSIVQIF